MSSAPDSELPAAPPSGLSLNDLQRWFLEQVTGPHRTANAAAASFPAPERAIEQVIRPSKTLTAEQRMRIYTEQYMLRLQGICRDRHPALAELLGTDEFEALVTDYLSRFPPYGYTLNNLCHTVPYYLERYCERPDQDLLLEVSRLEQAISEGYDTYVVGRVTSEDLTAVAAEAWPLIRFRLDPSVRLMAFEYDVVGIYDAVKENRSLPELTPQKTWAAVWRHDGLVWRQPISRPRFEILSAFAAGETVTVALERASDIWEGDEDGLVSTVFSWFSSWVQEDFFSAIVLPGS